MTPRFDIARDESDLPAIVRLAQRAHAESRLRHLPFSEEKVQRLARRAMAEPARHAVMLARRGAEPVGFLYCSVGEYFIGTGALLATVHNLNVAREHRRRLRGGRIAMGLLNGARTWALARGAVELSVNVSSGVEVERTARLLGRLGFATTGGNHTLRLEPRGRAPED